MQAKLTESNLYLPKGTITTPTVTIRQSGNTLTILEGGVDEVTTTTAGNTAIYVASYRNSMVNPTLYPSHAVKIKGGVILEFASSTIDEQLNKLSRLQEEVKQLQEEISRRLEGLL